jgi:hypothetical protein
MPPLPLKNAASEPNLAEKAKQDAREHEIIEAYKKRQELEEKRKKDGEGKSILLRDG